MRKRPNALPSAPLFPALSLVLLLAPGSRWLQNATARTSSPKPALPVTARAAVGQASRSLGPRAMVYLLWDWFDGGLFEAW